MNKETEPISILIHRKPIDHLLGTTKPISSDVIDRIVGGGRNILDYGRYMGQPETELRDRLEEVPSARRKIIEDVVIPSVGNSTISTLHEPLSLKRINPETVWEGDGNGNKPDLFFGMGGGSTSIIRAATFEALTMFLTTEALRRKMGLGKARAILANRITFTNLPYSSDFLPNGSTLAQVQQVLKNEGPEGIEKYSEIQTKINRRLGAERDIYALLIKRMGFDIKNWDVFLQTDIAQVVDEEALNRYEQTTKVHSKLLSNLSGLDEYHYAQEDGIIDALVNGPLGGVKVGWFIRNLDEVNGGYIMDEQPFHARWIVGQALREDTNGENKVTLAYAKAAPRLYPDAYGNLRKASPYICYDPEDMITLHPKEDIVGKFQSATQAGGGLHFAYIRNYYSSIVAVFEELTGIHLNEVQIDGHKVSLIPYAPGDKKTWGMIPLRVKAMRDWLVDGNEDEITDLWRAFDENPPKASTGLPMKLPASKYLEELGIQPKDLYYRIKDQSYGDETFLELSSVYQGDSERIDLTRDILILASLVNEKIAATGNQWEKTNPDGSMERLKIDRIYRVLGKIGLNAGIDPLNPSSSFYKNADYAPDLLLRDTENSGLHINPDVAQWIALQGTDNVKQMRERLDSILAVMSYPDTDQVREKAKELGYDIKGITDKELKVLQTLAEEFFESRLKGSTPRKKWMETYSNNVTSHIVDNNSHAESILTDTVDQYVISNPEQEGIRTQLTKTITTLQDIRDRIQKQSWMDGVVPHGLIAAEEILRKNIPVLEKFLVTSRRFDDLSSNPVEEITLLPITTVSDIQGKIDELLLIVSAIPSIEAVNRLNPHLKVTLQTTKRGYGVLRDIAKEYITTRSIQEIVVPSRVDKAVETFGNLDNKAMQAIRGNKELLDNLYEDAVGQAKVQLGDAKKRSNFRKTLVDEMLKELRNALVTNNDGLMYSRYQMLINEIIENESLTEDSDGTTKKSEEVDEKAKNVVISGIARERVIKQILDSLERDQTLCKALAGPQRITPEALLAADEEVKRKAINKALDSSRHIILSMDPPRIFYGKKYLDDAEKQIREEYDNPSGLSTDELATIARMRKVAKGKTVFTIADEHLRNQIEASLEDGKLLDIAAQNSLNNMLPQMSRNAVDTAIKSLGITIDDIIKDPTVLDRSTESIVELAIENFRIHS